MRRRQSLGGTDCLGKNLLAQLRSKAALRDQVDLAAQESLEAILDLEEVEVADRRVEVDEQVDIASWGRLVARHGAEQRQAPDSELAEFPDVLGDDLEDVGTPHEGHHRPQPSNPDPNPALDPCPAGCPAERAGLRTRRLAGLKAGLRS